MMVQCNSVKCSAFITFSCVNLPNGYSLTDWVNEKVSPREATTSKDKSCQYASHLAWLLFEINKTIKGSVWTESVEKNEDTCRLQEQKKGNLNIVMGLIQI